MKDFSRALTLYFIIALGYCTTYVVELSTVEVPYTELTQHKDADKTSGKPTHHFNEFCRFWPCANVENTKDNHGRNFDKYLYRRHSDDDRTNVDRDPNEGDDSYGEKHYNTDDSGVHLDFLSNTMTSNGENIHMDDMPCLRKCSKFARDPLSLNSEEFFGSNLFGPDRRSCFSNAEVSLLVTRRNFEILVPKGYPGRLLSNRDVCMLLNYFNKIRIQIRVIMDADVRDIIERAYYDAIGGFLRARLLPIVQLSYYAGQVKFSYVERIWELYRLHKYNLNTHGDGWRRPSRRLFEHIYSLDLRPLRWENNTKAGDGCNVLDLNSFERNANNAHMLVSLPKLDPEDEDGFLWNIDLPFRRNRFFNLRSSRSAFIIVRFHMAVTRCYEEASMCPDVYNKRFRRWISRNLKPHFKDELFYPGFGGILRVYKHLKRPKKSVEHLPLADDSHILNILKSKHVAVENMKHENSLQFDDLLHIRNADFEDIMDNDQSENLECFPRCHKLRENSKMSVNKENDGEGELFAGSQRLIMDTARNLFDDDIFNDVEKSPSSVNSREMVIPIPPKARYPTATHFDMTDTKFSLPLYKSSQFHNGTQFKVANANHNLTNGMVAAFALKTGTKTVAVNVGPPPGTAETGARNIGGPDNEGSAVEIAVVKPIISGNMTKSNSETAAVDTLTNEMRFKTAEQLIPIESASMLYTKYFNDTLVYVPYFCLLVLLMLVLLFTILCCGLVKTGRQKRPKVCEPYSSLLAEKSADCIQLKRKPKKKNFWAKLCNKLKRKRKPSDEMVILTSQSKSVQPGSKGNSRQRQGMNKPSKSRTHTRSPSRFGKKFSHKLIQYPYYINLYNDEPLSMPVNEYDSRYVNDYNLDGNLSHGSQNGDRRTLLRSQIEENQYSCPGRQSGGENVQSNEHSSSWQTIYGTSLSKVLPDTEGPLQ